MMIRTIYDGKQKVQKKDEKNHNEFLAACENFLWQKKNSCRLQQIQFIIITNTNMHSDNSCFGFLLNS